MNRVVSQNAKHNIEIFFTEMIDNADQATVSSVTPHGKRGRHVHFDLNAAEGTVIVKDNGYGQDADGLARMAQMGKHIEKGGNSGTRVGKFGVGFNAAASSVSRKVRLESRQLSSRVVNTLSFQDIETEAADPMSDDWGGEEDHRLARPEDDSSYMMVVLEDVMDVVPDAFTKYINENGLNRARSEASLGLDRKLINIYYLHMFPPAWAHHVFHDLAPQQAAAARGSRARATTDGGRCGSFDPNGDWPDRPILEPLGISIKLTLGEPGVLDRRTGLENTGILADVRRFSGLNVIQQNFNDAQLKEETA
eukprot:5026660-Prymnesium_polylepis.2